MQRQNNRYGFWVSFIDILFNLLIVFITLAIIELLLIKQTTVDGVKNKNEFVVTLNWPKGNNDVDIWIQEPGGIIVNYVQREGSVVHLDRDDLGDSNDIMEIDGEKVVNPLNQEIVGFRGIKPGEYIINIHLYRTVENYTHSKPLNEPINVVVKLDKMNPIVKTIFVRELSFTDNRQEIHVARFTVGANGDIHDVTYLLPLSLIAQFGKGERR